MKNKGGRPTVMTDIVLKKLEESFSMGCTDVEACFYADITPPTLYHYQEKNPGFVYRKQALKSNPSFLARKTLLIALEDHTDINTAKYQLDKVDGRAKQAIDLNAKLGLTVTRTKKSFDGEDDDVDEV